MAFNTSPGRAEYTASAAQIIFTFTFKIFDTSDIKVYLTPVGQTADDTADILIETTNYTVTINGDNGGDVDLTSGATLNDEITLVRSLPTTRETEYQQNGDLTAETLNEDQDYQTYLILDGATVSERALTVPDSAQGFNTTLPAPGADKMFIYASDGKSIALVDPTSTSFFKDAFIVDIMATILGVDETTYGSVNVRGYYVANDGGGGLFNWDSTVDKSTADGGIIIDPDQSLATQGDGVGNGCWVRQYEGLINSNWYGNFDDSAAALDGREIDDGGLWQSICDAKGKGAIWKYGNNYQQEGVNINPASYVFLHDYRPMTPFGSDGANVYLGGRAGSFDAAPDAGAIGNYLIHCSYNTALGHQALNNLTTAYNCTCSGVNAGRYITQGYGNTFNGRDAGHETTIGFYNTAIGQSALYNNTIGNENIAIGLTALRNINDNQNIGIGRDSLFNMTSGIRNVGVGYQAGYGLTSGDANTIIGNTPIANYPNGAVDGLLLICAGQVPRIQGDSGGKLSLSGDIPTASLEYRRIETTVYDGAALGGQVDKGSTLLIANDGTINNGISQIVLQPRIGEPVCRIVATDGLASTLRFVTNDAERVLITDTGSLKPTNDNTQQLGGSTNRWSVVFAGTGTINTSDDREKTYIDILDIEKAVALELKANMRKFKYNDAIKTKGADGARIHFGASAQTVKSIFEKHGLAADDYALLCYDEWEAEYEQVINTEEILDEDDNVTQEATYKNGDIVLEAGNRYGLRYEELLSFIISAI